MSYELFFYNSSDDEDEVNNELTIFTEACQAAYEASKPKIQQTPVERDRYGAHNRLVAAYFSEHPQYEEATLFGISSLMNCTSAIRQMTYGAVPDALDEYLQVGATTTRRSIQMFCMAIMELHGEEFLRKLTYTDMEKLYAYHEEKHGFPRMLGNIDCTDWPWENCPVAFKAQFSRGDHGPDPFILLEATASNDLWIWHAFFGVSGMNNDVNVLRQSPLFNDLKSGKASDVPFVANNVPYKKGYYLTDGIYPQWSVLIKSIKNSGTNDHKRILYKTKHEAARKDVERAFGVLKKKWKLIKHPARDVDYRMCDLYIIANDKKKEKIASGLLSPFIAHLKAAQDQIAQGGYSVFLTPPPASPWFTKSTLQSFVRFVSTPEILERVYTIESEILQIQDAISIQGNNDILQIQDQHVKPVPSSGE
ncbi:ALP1-like protein, partial [Tanacetum coccineum]